MKKQFIIGNWKSNKTTGEAKQWLYEFSQHRISRQENTTIIVCPAFTLLSYVHGFIEANDLPLYVGAQNVSPFEMGAYTGEVAAKQVKEFAKYVIVGHSERRNLFGESAEMLAKKVKQAKSENLTVIYCVQDEKSAIPENVDIIAYEPIFAIGSGNADTPENTENVSAQIKERFPAVPVIYGGSVIPENFTSFLIKESIDGVLLGGASLDAEKFCRIITYAKKA